MYISPYGQKGLRALLRWQKEQHRFCASVCVCVYCIIHDPNLIQSIWTSSHPTLAWWSWRGLPRSAPTAGELGMVRLLGWRPCTCTGAQSMDCASEKDPVCFFFHQLWRQLRFASVQAKQGIAFSSYTSSRPPLLPRLCRSFISCSVLFQWPPGCIWQVTAVLWVGAQLNHT